MSSVSKSCDRLQRPYEKSAERIETPSAIPIAVWAVLLFVASVWLTLLNSAQQTERHKSLESEVDELREMIREEKIEKAEITSKAEKLSGTLREMGWTPPAKNK